MKTGILTLRAENGEPIIIAHVLCRSLSGRIALHVTTKGNRRKGEGNTYTLTHVPTGNGIVMGIMRRKDAEQLLDVLDSRYDWAFRSRYSHKVYRLGMNAKFLDALNAPRRYAGRRTDGHNLSRAAWLRMAVST